MKPNSETINHYIAHNISKNQLNTTNKIDWKMMIYYKSSYYAQYIQKST